MRLPRPIDAATQARVSTEGRRSRNPLSLQSPQSPSVMSASLFIRFIRPFGDLSPAALSFYSDRYDEIHAART
jgi:hypothetical protein